jgi:hypothetical protein
LANKKFEETKEKIPKKSLKKLLGKAASAILTAAALGKRRRAEYDGAASIPSASDKPTVVKNSKRVNNQQNARSNVNDSSTKPPLGCDSTRDIVLFEKKKLHFASKMGSPDAVRLMGLDRSPETMALPTKLFIENAQLGLYEDDGYDAESENSSVVKKMRVEIDRLQEENVELLNEQFTRETEIRVEVIKLVMAYMLYSSCGAQTVDFFFLHSFSNPFAQVSQEMAERSAHLLDQVRHYFLLENF